MVNIYGQISEQMETTPVKSLMWGLSTYLSSKQRWKSWHRAKGGFWPLMRSWCEPHSAGFLVGLSLGEIRRSLHFHWFVFHHPKVLVCYFGGALRGNGFKHRRIWMGISFNSFIYIPECETKVRLWEIICGD